MVDRINDVVYNPIEEADEEDKQERLLLERKKLKEEREHNENDN